MRSQLKTYFNLIPQGPLQHELHHRVNLTLRQDSWPCLYSPHHAISQSFGYRVILNRGQLRANNSSNWAMCVPMVKEDEGRCTACSTGVKPPNE